MDMIAPNGLRIIGTLETIPGCALIMPDTAVTLKDGTFDFEWDGETTVWWDGQQTVKRRKCRVFVDEDYNEWLESELKLAEVEL